MKNIGRTFTYRITNPGEQRSLGRMGAYPGVYLRTYVPDVNDAPGQYYGPGNYSSLGSLNNKARSITVAAWSEVVLFDGLRYTGDRIMISNSQPTALVVKDLGVMKDRVKSMSVRKLQQ